MSTYSQIPQTASPPTRNSTVHEGRSRVSEGAPFPTAFTHETDHESSRTSASSGDSDIEVPRYFDKMVLLLLLLVQFAAFAVGAGIAIQTAISSHEESKQQIDTLGSRVRDSMLETSLVYWAEELTFVNRSLQIQVLTNFPAGELLSDEVGTRYTSFYDAFERRRAQLYAVISSILNLVSVTCTSDRGDMLRMVRIRAPTQSESSTNGWPIYLNWYNKTDMNQPLLRVQRITTGGSLVGNVSTYDIEESIETLGLARAIGDTSIAVGQMRSVLAVNSYPDYTSQWIYVAGLYFSDTRQRYGTVQYALNLEVVSKVTKQLFNNTRLEQRCLLMETSGRVVITTHGTLTTANHTRVPCVAIDDPVVNAVCRDLQARYASRNTLNAEGFVSLNMRVGFHRGVVFLENGGNDYSAGEHSYTAQVTGNSTYIIIATVGSAALEGSVGGNRLLSVTVVLPLAIGALIIGIFLSGAVYVVSARHEKAVRRANRVALQLKTRNVELQEARKEAEQSNEAKRTFMSYIFHEVRVPMNAVMLGIELLLSSKLSPNLKQRYLVPGTEDSTYLTCPPNQQRGSSRSSPLMASQAHSPQTEGQPKLTLRPLYDDNETSTTVTESSGNSPEDLTPEMLRARAQQRDQAVGVKSGPSNKTAQLSPTGSQTSVVDADGIMDLGEVPARTSPAVSSPASSLHDGIKPVPSGANGSKLGRRRTSFSSSTGLVRTHSEPEGSRVVPRRRHSSGSGSSGDSSQGSQGSGAGQTKTATAMERHRKLIALREIDTGSGTIAPSVSSHATAAAARDGPEPELVEALSASSTSQVTAKAAIENLQRRRVTPPFYPNVDPDYNPHLTGLTSSSSSAFQSVSHGAHSTTTPFSAAAKLLMQQSSAFSGAPPIDSTMPSSLSIASVFSASISASSSSSTPINLSPNSSPLLSLRSLRTTRDGARASSRSRRTAQEEQQELKEAAAADADAERNLFFADTRRAESMDDTVGMYFDTDDTATARDRNGSTDRNAGTAATGSDPEDRRNRELLDKQQLLMRQQKTETAVRHHHRRGRSRPKHHRHGSDGQEKGSPERKTPSISQSDTESLQRHLPIAVTGPSESDSTGGNLRTNAVSKHTGSKSNSATPLLEDVLAGSMRGDEELKALAMVGDHELDWPEVEETLRTVKDQIDITRKILDDVLSMQKIEQGKFQIDSGLFNLPEFVLRIHMLYKKEFSPIYQEEEYKTVGARAARTAPRSQREGTPISAASPHHGGRRDSPTRVTFSPIAEVKEERRSKDQFSLGDYAGSHKEETEKERRSKTTFHVVLDPRLPEVLCGDKHRLQQVVCNFISNSFKFTPDGGVIAFQIRLMSETPEGHTIKMSVCDTGVGISPEDQKLLFQPYVQIKAGELQKGGGTGLGLSICQHVVKLHAGQIGVESEDGKGSEFYFTFFSPRVPPPKPPKGSSMMSKSNTTPASPAQPPSVHAIAGVVALATAAAATGGAISLSVADASSSSIRPSSAPHANRQLTSSYATSSSTSTRLAVSDAEAAARKRFGTLGDRISRLWSRDIPQKSAPSRRQLSSHATHASSSARRHSSANNSPGTVATSLATSSATSSSATPSSGALVVPTRILFQPLVHSDSSKQRHRKSSPPRKDQAKVSPHSSAVSSNVSTPTIGKGDPQDPRSLHLLPKRQESPELPRGKLQLTSVAVMQPPAELIQTHERPTQRDRTVSNEESENINADVDMSASAVDVLILQKQTLTQQRRLADQSRSESDALLDSNGPRSSIEQDRVERESVSSFGVQFGGSGSDTSPSGPASAGPQTDSPQHRGHSPAHAGDIEMGFGDSTSLPPLSRKTSPPLGRSSPRSAHQSGGSPFTRTRETGVSLAASSIRRASPMASSRASPSHSTKVGASSSIISPSLSSRQLGSVNSSANSSPLLIASTLPPSPEVGTTSLAEGETKRKEEPVDRRPRALLVEDSLPSAKLTVRVLGRCGWACDVAANGKIALELVEQANVTLASAATAAPLSPASTLSPTSPADPTASPLPTTPVARSKPNGFKYDIVLMDRNMPVMDGLTATRLLRAAPYRVTIPMVGLTGCALDSEREEFIDAGVDGVLTKPVSIPELQAVLLSQCPWLQNP